MSVKPAVVRTAEFITAGVTVRFVLARFNAAKYAFQIQDENSTVLASVLIHEANAPDEFINECVRWLANRFNVPMIPVDPPTPPKAKLEIAREMPRQETE